MIEIEEKNKIDKGIKKEYKQQNQIEPNIQKEYLGKYDIGQNFNKEKNLKAKKSLKKPIIIIGIVLLLIVIGVALILYFTEIPVVNFNGKKVETISYGETYNDKGLKVYTKFKNISDKIIIENNIDTSKIGHYTITYKVPYLNQYKMYTRNVNIVDTTAPSISLIGDTHYNLEYGTEYQEPGYKATDNYDGDITNKVVVTKVDIDENNFEEHYTVNDSSGNNFKIIRYVKITDNIAPKITLNGNSVISVIKGSIYNEQGAKAIDNKDGDISKNIQIIENVDTSKNGTYTITYTASDYSGNKTTKQRKVIVSETPVTGVIYLTFDDGPSSTITPKILDVLEEKGVNATFFILNYNDKNEHLVKRTVNEGNAIGIHGYSHDYSKIYTSVDACYENIIKLQQKIYNSTGITTKIVRFPGGSSNTVSKKYCEDVMTQITQKVLSEGFKYYDWNIASGDSGDVNTKEAVYNNVTKALKPGRDNIILMHDFTGNNKTLDALPQIIDYGLSNGYMFDVITTDTEMLAQKIQN
ncbi:MAG: polysaccharide deacetylase family protein [Clostridia bacterium]|nr:polysaccharide deacetylase family protein [Clostridia bacterium]